MSLLNVANLSFCYPSHPISLFEKVSFEINPGDRIGLVGPNGSGKTTLLRLLAGELEPQTGSIVRRQQLRLSYVRQESTAPDEQLLREYVLMANPELGMIYQQFRALETQLDCCEHASHYAECLNTYQERGGFRLQAEAEKLLDGLGFRPHERDLPMGLLSSGQRARSELIRLLLSPANLLLIDEPTNHLDIVAREWLENYLSNLEAAYLVVSHDRTFLNEATSRIFEIRHLGFAVYEGNYQFYLGQRELRERQVWQQFEAQQRRSEAADYSARRRLSLANKVARAPRGIRSGHDFYRSKAAKVARTGRILRKRVLREPVAMKPWQEDPIPALRFENVSVSTGVALRVEGLSKTCEDKVLFHNLNFYVQSGERWGILGPNGSGKTTLIQVLLGEVPADAGRVQFGRNVRIAYYAQEGENLDLAKSPVELGLEVNPNETWVRTILGCLRLRGEKAAFPIQTMSAGERAKVALARTLLGEANLLLLDEPTNHLDIDAREAVEETLSHYPGTILFVSHDRYFINALADEILDLSPKGSSPESEGP